LGKFINRKEKGMKRSMARGHMINKINRLIPEANAVPREDFDGHSDRGIWLRGSESYHEDARIFNYWAEGADMLRLHPKLVKILEKGNWYDEPYDAGTLMLWPDY
jgi:hypothetical protein|tara:strand:+ start:718 stop:1032 length:315 start_codon:yes stop_codon:yes gene_type:complete